MKTLKLVGILAAVVMLVVVATYLFEKNTDEPEEISVIPVNNDELICDTKINFAKKAFDAMEDVPERKGM